MQGEIPPQEGNGRTGSLGTLAFKATPDDLRLAVASVGVVLALLGLIGMVGYVIGLLDSRDISDEWWNAYVKRSLALGSVGSLVSLIFGIWAFKLARGTSLRGDMSHSIAVLMSFVGIYFMARGAFGSLNTLSWAVSPHGFVSWYFVLEFVLIAAPWLVVGFMLIQISRHRLSYRPKWMKKELVDYQVP